MVAVGIGEVASGLILLMILSFMAFSTLTATIISAVSLLISYLCAKHHSEYWKRRGVPAPEANYIFGNVLQMQRKGFKQYDLENMKKYGGYWGGMFLNYPMLDICDLDMLRKVLIKDFGTFQNRMMDDFFAGGSPIRLHMLNTLKDAHWKNVRNTITPAFTTGRIKKMIPIMSRCIDETEAIIDEAIASSNIIIDVKRLFSNTGMDIIAQVAFGVVLSTQRDTNSDFTRYAKKLFDVSLVDFPLLFMALFPNVTRFVEKNFNYQFIGNQCDTFFEELLRKIVKERRSNPRKENPDFLQLLLNTVDEGNNETDDGRHEVTHNAIGHVEKVPLDELDILANGYVFLIAGYETTSITLQFIAYVLARYPEIQDRLYEEVTGILGDKDVVEYDDIMQMHYMEQVMCETLRMYPPVVRTERDCGTETVVNGVPIEKGTSVHVAVYAIHHNEEYYPNPEKFDPDRFSSAEKALRDPLAFIPFGYGPRNCIGMRFALIEIRFTMARLIRKYKFILPDEMKDKPLELDTSMMTKPVKPIMIKMEKRDV